MKIAFFIEHISNGGAERVITNLANSFAKHNHEVIMITHYCPKKLPHRFS